MKALFVIILALVPSAVFCQESIQLVVEPTMTFTIGDDSQFSGTFVLSESSLPTDPVRLLQTPNVLSDLELVDEQKSQLAAKIAALKKARQRQEEQLAKEFEGRPELEQKLQESRTKYRDAVKAASEDILLPFQLDRLKQIRLQSELRTGGSRAVESESFAELLGLTAEQKAELQKKAAEAEEKLVVEIRELKQKRHREVLEDVLTKKQLQILDENLGKPISDTSK